MSKKILVMDDDPTIADLLREALADEGYETYMTTQSLRFYDAVTEYKPDLILLDLMMPILDGYGVMEVLAADALLRDSPAIVVMSAAQRLSEGAFPLAMAQLPKPFAIDDVLETVSKLTHQIMPRRLADDMHPEPPPT